MKSYRETIRSLMEETFNKNILNEAASQGVPFEWAIVRKCLDKSLTNKELQKRITKYPQLNDFSEKISSDADQAIINIPKKLYKLANHTDELGVKGEPEPKTDILFGPSVRVSVKMNGAIQLASGEGRSTAKMLRAVVSEVMNIEPTFKDKILEEIIKRIDNMPTKMISPQNLERLQQENPKRIAHMIKNGKILDEYNWRIWEKNNKQFIKSKMAKFIEENEKFTFILVDEALTGKRVFTGKYELADANYIITPKYFRKIDNTYVNEMIKRTKLDVRAKSRSGVTSSTVRFDVREEFMNIIKEDLNIINEGIWDTIKQLGSSIKQSLLSWWEKLKTKLKNFYSENIEQIIRDESNFIDIDIEMTF